MISFKEWLDINELTGSSGPRGYSYGYGRTGYQSPNPSILGSALRQLSKQVFGGISKAIDYDPTSGAKPADAEAFFRPYFGDVSRGDYDDENYHVISVIVMRDNKTDAGKEKYERQKKKARNKIRKEITHLYTVKSGYSDVELSKYLRTIRTSTFPLSDDPEAVLIEIRYMIPGRLEVLKGPVVPVLPFSFGGGRI